MKLLPLNLSSGTRNIVIVGAVVVGAVVVGMCVVALATPRVVEGMAAATTPLVPNCAPNIADTFLTNTGPCVVSTDIAASPSHRPGTIATAVAAPGNAGI